MKMNGPGRMLILLALSSAAVAAGPVGWRTDGTGRYAAAQPPLTWSKESNVVWTTVMPAWGNSSVVLTNDRILVGAEPATLVAIDARDGRILWQQPNTILETLPPAEATAAAALLAQAESLASQLNKLEQELRALKKQRETQTNDTALAEKQTALTEQVAALKGQLAPAEKYRLPATHGENGHSSPTPVTDGQHAWAAFGNGVAACYDLAGKRQWIRLVQRPTAGWGQSSSPVLVGGTLVVLVNDLFGLDAATGQERWRVPSQQRWGTPVAARVGGTDVVITPAGQVVRVADGQVVADKLSTLDYCAPIVDGETVYFIQHGGHAVKLVAGEGGKVEAQKLWETTPAKERYYASPLLHNGLIYAVNQHGVFSVIDAATGTVVSERKLGLGATIYSSVTLAGDWLYVTAENGTTAVLEANREAKLVATNKLERWRSCPVFRGSRLFVRTRDALYCLGAK